MSTTRRPRIAINGFGRIGRCLTRVAALDPNCPFDLVAANDLADPSALLYLTKYDSTHGKFKGNVALNGDVLTIGRTDEEAREKQALLQNLIHPEVGLSLLLGMFGDLSGYPIDGPVPEIPTETNGLKSILQSWHDRLKREPMTIRQLYQAVASGSGHLSLVGSVKTIADQFEDWFTTKACDGFAIMVPFMPGGIDDAVNLLVPELQRRGLFHLDYEGHTLRESLGLPRPANRFAKAK